MAIHKNVKVTDIPDDWKKAQNNLKIKIHNADDIGDEFADIENTGHHIKHSRPVRNLESSLRRWGKSKEIANIKKIDEAFLKTEQGQDMVAAWKDVFHAMDEVVVEHGDEGIVIDNDHLDNLSDELEDLGGEYERLGKSDWGKKYESAWKAAFTNKEAKSLGRRAEAFKASPEGKYLKMEVQDFKDSLKENVEVTDIPETWKDDMYLF